MQTCPYCAEEIKDAAIICRYCGNELDIPAVETARQTASKEVVHEEPPSPKPALAQAADAVKSERPWYRQTWAYAIWLIFFSTIWSILKLTDDRAGKATRVLAVFLLIPFTFIVISYLFIGGMLAAGATTLPQIASMPRLEATATKLPPTARPTSTPTKRPTATTRPTLAPVAQPTGTLFYSDWNFSTSYQFYEWRTANAFLGGEGYSLRIYLDGLQHHDQRAIDWRGLVYDAWYHPQTESERRLADEFWCLVAQTHNLDCSLVLRLIYQAIEGSSPDGRDTSSTIVGNLSLEVMRWKSKDGQGNDFIQVYLHVADNTR